MYKVYCYINGEWKAMISCDTLQKAKEFFERYIKDSNKSYKLVKEESILTYNMGGQE